MIAFNKYYNHFNILSITIVVVSLFLLTFKGLNFGIDFKGGLLVEISLNKNVEIVKIRTQLNNLVPGDFSIQSLDNSKNNYLIKVETNSSAKGANQKLISEIKKNLNKEYSNVDYRRVEYVGPTVSKELIKAGILSIIIAIGAMLIYIWFRFEPLLYIYFY